jgi:hypothetical protein
MCVSYRRLNSVTLPFEYPIPRCEDAIDDCGDSAGKLFFISLDARSGYHQVAVRACNQDKLAFFSPDNEKYASSVMPFGPHNAPGFYTCMMHVLSLEWDALFKARHPNAKHTGDRVIIDGICLYAVDKVELLFYLECVLEVCQKYRLSLKLSKCNFLKEHVEYAGHDLTSDGNCPSKSKFGQINNWPLPATGQALYSLIQLCNFYNKYCSWLEIKLKPFRKLIKLYHRKPIPPETWMPALRLLFDEVKCGVTSSPCLTRYDHTKPTFLKTDRSADGFGSILMQPDDSPASVAATKKLAKTGICDFDLTLTGARLRPVRFDSRKCTEQERHFHSFVGEAACGRWAISKNKKFLWGTLFYWICDCSAMHEILNYDGQIHVVRCWAQELLGYHFAVIHCSTRIMQDIDAISRRYAGGRRQYMLYAAQLSVADRARQPRAYDMSQFPDHAIKCLEPAPGQDALSRPEPVTGLGASSQSVSDPDALSCPEPVTSPDASSHSVSALVPAPSLDPFFDSLNRVVFTSWLASLIPTLPPDVPFLSPALRPASAIRSFTASTGRANSGLSSQPLANICSTWLSVDPGLPSIAFSLPSLHLLSWSLCLRLPHSPSSTCFSRRLSPNIDSASPTSAPSSAHARLHPASCAVPCINAPPSCPAQQPPTRTSSLLPLPCPRSMMSTLPCPLLVLPIRLALPSRGSSASSPLYTS